jgi:spermidine/putrescine transport system permease protein
MGKSFDVRSQLGFTTIAMFTFFALYVPIVVLVVFSFNAGPGLSNWQGVSLRWFYRAAGNDAVINAAIRSFQIATCAAIIATFTATLAAIATTRTKPYRGLTAKYTFLNIPLMVPEIVTAVALLIFFSRIKIWTGYTGLGYLIAAHTAFCIPFAYLPIRARLEGMDDTLERAAADLYATPIKTFRYVTMPLLWPGIIAGMMLSFVISFDDVIITEFVKSGGQDTLPTYLLGQIRREITPEVNAISAAFLLLSIAAVTVFFFINRKKS